MTCGVGVQSWMNSDGHCRSIFYAPYNHMGAGYWRDDTVANTYKHFWITVRLTCLQEVEGSQLAVNTHAAPSVPHSQQHLRAPSRALPLTPHPS